MLETVQINHQLVETLDYDQVLVSGSRNVNLMISDSGQRLGEIDTRYMNGTLFSQLQYQWAYDNDNRLVSQTLSVTTGASNVPVPYADAFKYDLSNNRVEEDMNTTAANLGQGNAIAGGLTIKYTYNHDDQLQAEVETGYGGAAVYNISYGYDADGNLSTQSKTAGTATTSSTYTYDLQNQMTKAVIGGTETDYGYDTSGVRVSEGGSSGPQTYYLNDPNNPTGYTKAIEDKSGASASSAATIRSYVLGLKVEAQSDAANSTLYTATDGHGSTMMVVSTAGQVIENYSYDADGKLLLAQRLSYTSSGATSTVTNITNAGTATTWLFGGDGVYDPASGWTYHLARWTNGFWFTQADGDGHGNNADPVSLNKYLYGSGDPIDNDDPTGAYASPIPNNIMGTFVSTYVGRQFEAFTDVAGVQPAGVSRFGNRTVRRIINSISPGANVPYLSPNRDRPDLVQVNGSTGDVYEIKAGNIERYLINPLFRIDAQPAINDLNYYVPLLNGFSTPVTFAAGTSYASGVEAYPAFPFNPPDEMLVTFSNYAVAPGAILWDFVPTWEGILIDTVEASVGALAAYGAAQTAQAQYLQQILKIANAGKRNQSAVEVGGADLDASLAADETLETLEV